MEENRKRGRPKGSNKLKRSKDKKRFLEELQKSKGIIFPAVQAVGINRQTFYNYYNQDEDFRRDVDEIKETTIDFVESKLLKEISEGNMTGIIFYLKCKGRDRGYIERVENNTNMTIDAIKIKYIMPQEDDRLLEDHNIITPLDNPTIKLELPE